MKDDRGLYYHPFPLNKRARMYVRKIGDEIQFRLWNQDDPDLWAEHGWVAYDAIVEASNIYDGNGFDPHQAYDIHVAKALLEEKKGP